MNKTFLGLLVVFGLISLGFAGLTRGSNAVVSEEPAIMASPSVIILSKVTSVTVHTNIPLSAVVPDSVTLNGEAPLGVWADSCGHLAARFAVADLNLKPGRATLTLCGDLADGGFAADDIVTVK